jgi:hypothetical protein
MRQCQIFFIAVLLVLLTSFASGQEQPPTFRDIKLLTWQGTGPGGLGVQFVTSTAVDSQGSVYAAGSFASSRIVLGNITLTNTGGWCAFVVKFDSTLQPLWAKSGSGTNIIVTGMALDRQGNCHLALWTPTPGEFDGMTFTSISNQLSVVLKYSPAGELQWHHKIPGVLAYGWNQPIAVDSNANVFFSGALEDDTYRNATFFLRKINSDGMELWSKREGKIDLSWSPATVTDNAGNCLLVGSFGSGTTSFGAFTLTNRGSTDIFMAKYSSSGNVIWAQSAGGTGTDEGWDIAVDANRDCYVTGTSSSSGAQFGNVVLTGTDHCFVAKYRAGGGLAWVKRIDKTPWAGVPLRISVDQLGNPLLSADVPIEEEETTIIPSFIAKLNAEGDELWRKQVKGFDLGNAWDRRVFWPTSRVTADSANNLYIAGNIPIQQGYAEFDGFTFNPEDLGSFIAKLSFDPMLRSTRNGNQLILSWPTNEPGFVLEATSSLGGTNWLPVTTEPFIAGGEYRFISNLTGSRRFFRLRK